MRATKLDVKKKICHFAAKVNERGDVSAFCYTRPRPVDLRVANWTNRTEAVTCTKCRKLLRLQPPAGEG